MELNKIKRNNKLVLIASTICILLIILVGLFSNQLKAQADNHPVSGEQSKDPISTTLSTNISSDQLKMDMQFLESLSLLNQIKIDSSFFTNKAFKNFKDNTVELQAIQPGRPNPFVPIGIVGPTSFPNTPNRNPTVPLAENDTMKTLGDILVITKQPSKIWTKTADLSGTVINTDNSPSSYFEYGPTTDLGSITTQTKPNKDGNFIVNIRGLTPKTMYYYRAAAKINENQTLYGDVVTFTTK